MTGKELYLAALSLLFETEETAGDAEIHAPVLIGSMLGDLFFLNNILREEAGKEKLSEIPAIQTLDEEVPYEEKLVRGCMPYGLAQRIVYDDDDMGKVDYFQQLYVNAANALSRARGRSIADRYPD